MYKLTSGWPQIVGTETSVNPDTNPEYLQWLSEGNTPDPADPIPEPVELTPQEKLASAGLSVDELKVLLGIAV